MKKLLVGLVCAAMIAPALAGPPNHGGGYNRGGVPAYGGHYATRHYAPRHYAPYYRGGYYGGYYGPYNGNPWYWAVPLAAGVIGYAIATAPPPVYASPTAAPTDTRRLINGVEHELRYQYFEDCACTRAIWVPLQ